MIYFTSDTHFHHKNVLNYSKRPWSDVESMNEALIANWNSRISSHDEVYHLGDFGFANKKMMAEVLSRLNGQKYLVRGNHDHSDIRKLAGWAWVKDYYELKVPLGADRHIQRIILCHYPIESWNARHHGSWHLHGHCHGSLTTPDWQKRMDVGVDPRNYEPVSLWDVEIFMASRGFTQLDHHKLRE